MSRVSPLKTAFLVTLALGLSACAAFDVEDVYGTQEAELIAFSTEAVELATQSALDQQVVERTVIAAEATMVMVRGVNQQLVSTLQSVVTPTPPLETRQQIDVTLAALFEGRRLFVKTGMGREIDANGCVVEPIINFTPSDTRLYATARAFNIEAGVPLVARWSYEGTLVYEESFVSPGNFADWCFWFALTPNEAEFAVGAWAVRLFADGFQLEDPISFTIIPD